MLKKLTGSARRLAILEAAVPVFARLGRDGTTTGEIAKAAGISEALLYKHFVSKDALYFALETHCIEATQIANHLFEEAVPSTETFILAAAIMMHAVFVGIGDQDEHENTKRLIVSSLLSNGELASAFLKKQIAPWLGFFRDSLEVAKSAGDIEADGESSSDMGVWFLHHLATSLHLFSLPGIEVVPYGANREQLADRALRFILRGMGFKSSVVNQYYSIERMKSIIKSNV